MFFDIIGSSFFAGIVNARKITLKYALLNNSRDSRTAFSKILNIKRQNAIGKASQTEHKT